MSSGGIRFKATLLVAVDKTQLGGDLILPSTAKEILSVTPYVIPTTFTADKISAVNLELESDDIDLSPTKIGVLINGPEDATVTAAASTMIYQTYDINAPIGSGAVVTAHATQLVDPTTDPYFGLGGLISELKSNKLQSFWTFGLALNNYGTGNRAYVAGATYRWSNSLRINHVYGWAATNATRTVDDSIGGTIKLVSSDFKSNLPQIYPITTMSENSLAAGNNQIPTISLWNVDIPTDKVIAVTEFFDQEGLAIAGGTAWISGISYNKVSIADRR